MENINSEPPPVKVTLHTLNAARVIAEYAVVHCHLSGEFPGEHGILSGMTVAESLMSFFFVLSGFVAMHCNVDEDFSQLSNAKEYIKRRFRKTYPFYLLMFLVDLPGAILTKNQYGCDLSWVSFASQPLLLQSWIGAYHLGTSNIVGWYMCTLYWLWVFFPCLKVKWMLQSYPWIKIHLMYWLGVALWIVMFEYSLQSTRTVPIFRLFEFGMGCAVEFTLERKIHGVFVMIGLAMFWVYCSLDFQYPDMWYHQPSPSNCTLWPVNRDKKISPTIVLNKFSIVWAVLIHWLAASELSSSKNCVVQALQYEGFKHLSKYSLHLYLSHTIVATCIKTIFSAVGLFAWWDLDTLIITCYLVAYAMYVWVQPIFDRLLGR